jgi:hypothetical protein
MSEARQPSGPLDWLAALLYVPVLYGLGWVLVQPLAWLGWLPPGEPLALLGTAVSFALFLLSLPAWLAWRWGEGRPWRALGLRARPAFALFAFGRGLLLAALLLLPLTLVLLAAGWADWRGTVAPGRLANAAALLLGVGLAEELVFRGWLWGELRGLLGSTARADRRAGLGQALVFSLAHTRFSLGPLASLALLGGLLLLGLVLARRRRADRGVLWGAVGLHGGLVGLWFLLAGGLLALSPQAPAWLVGPGGAAANPIGGVAGWLGLGGLLMLGGARGRPQPK